MDEFVVLPEDNENNLRKELASERSRIDSLYSSKKYKLEGKIRQMEEEPYSVKASDKAADESKKKFLIRLFFISFAVIFILSSLTAGIIGALVTFWVYAIPGAIVFVVSKAMSEGRDLFGGFKSKNGKLKKAYRKVSDDEKALLEELRSKLAQCDEEAENEIGIIEKNITSRINSYNENYNIAVEEAARYYNGSTTANAVIDFLWAAIDDKIKKADRDKFKVSEISVSDSNTLSPEGIYDEEGELVYSFNGRINNVTLPVMTALANIISTGLIFRGNMEYTEDLSGGECEFDASATPENTENGLRYRITVDYKAKNKAYFE